MLITNAEIYDLNSGFAHGSLLIRNGIIERIFKGELLPEGLCGEERLDAGGDYLIPGLVDVHFHGAAGEDFSDATLAGLQKIAVYEAQNGITAICPASMTLPEEKLTEICCTAKLFQEQQDREQKHQSGKHQERQACGTFHKNRTAAKLVGIHLEGPCISPKKTGAQNPDYVKLPDPTMFRRLQEAAGGLVRLITIAPECEGGLDFIREFHEEVHISLGHTVCDYETAAAAFAEGADHVTHLYNALSPYSHRAPGLFGAAADYCGAATGLSGAAADFYGAVTGLSGAVNRVSGAKRVYMELICDGIHLHPAAVRTAFRLFGAEQMILVSDTMRAAGMPDGAYTLGGLPVYVKGHEAALSDGTLAGSVTNLMDCMREAVRMGISLETAVRCASYQPAHSIGVEDRCGVLAEGRTADLVWLGREKLDVKAVFIDGE